jgi:quercetin dioxygenase-like cupin family protein
VDRTSTADFIDVLGPLVKPLTALSGPHDSYCVFQSVFPHGVVVPLHSHADRETFYILDGRIEGFAEQEWRSFGPGEVFDVPQNAPHAWRNFSGSPVSLLLITTMRLGRFLVELGKPASSRPPGPPTAADIERITTLAHDYGYWLGNPEENAAAGLAL